MSYCPKIDDTATVGEDTMLVERCEQERLLEYPVDLAVELVY